MDQMKVKGFEFEPISTPLYGFAGHAILPLGQIVLRISLGHEPRRVTKMTTFTVVDTPSASNGILGRSTLKDFRAVASLYHQKLKFCKKGVGVLCGDQKVARWCYERIVKEEGKRARVEVSMIRRGRSGLSVVRKEVREMMDEESEANLSMFSWSALELTGTTPSVAEHRLIILPNVCPIKQKKRHFGLEKDKAIRKEVGELLEGYHQIPLSMEDQDKVSFITSEGTFCYVVMPFGLKNLRATYQRLMDRVFSEQVGRNVKVYVDDIMGLWAEVEPSEVYLWGEEWEVSELYGDREGIEANPEKVRAIQDIVPSRGHNDVQNLTGRIAALARFISRSAHRSLPFFRTLRKAKKFEWNPDCEKAFRDLEKYLAELPVLAKLAAGEPLWVYLSAIEGAVSSVFVKLEGSTQQPVYYVSHALKGAEISPLGRILTHSDMSGHLIKWTTELGEYDIQYEPRTAIKAQALADFLAETVHQENKDPWKVYLDDFSSNDGSGVGVVLISQAGEEAKLAVRLDFRASNNEAEYEAVLAGLRAARNVGASRVLIFSDSQLVAQQMKGVYDVKDENLIEYAQEVDRVREKFTEITFEQIHRKENEKADTIAKMAGTMGSLKTRDVVFQVELTPHTSSPATEQEKEVWRTGIVNYLKEGKLPDNPHEARKLKTKCSRYVIVEEVLYQSCCSEEVPIGSSRLFFEMVEAEPLARITENDVLKFLWKNIVCRYGSNGHVEVTNRTLVQGLNVRLGNTKGNWVDELSSVLWAYRTTPREGTKETPFSLVYGNEAVLPA
ncbi:uncharacterized protein LOC142537709 [Primulina tabacum]|uniref:uncharacterized protein LOC142537709 n=1 Tax=Primulina tabacum TaxID=48773 RepID=UPI003F5926A3